MPEVKDQWLHFSPHQQKRKRAELVCISCHSKKIKCDLQVWAWGDTGLVYRNVAWPIQNRSNAGDSRCTACEDGDQHCQIRPSNRGKQRRMTFVEASSSSNPASPPSKWNIVWTVVNSGIPPLHASYLTAQSMTFADGMKVPRGPRTREGQKASAHH
jgi:hypothetical protein